MATILLMKKGDVEMKEEEEDKDKDMEVEDNIQQLKRVFLCN